jgi:hypothetical protein
VREKDPFDDLDSLQLTPELLAQVRPKPEGAAKPRKQRTDGNFYHVPEAWLRSANKAVKSRNQLMAAIELYRMWKLRQPGADYIVVSNMKFGSRDVKRRMIIHLWRAKLIAVQVNGPGRAPWVTVLMG